MALKIGSFLKNIPLPITVPTTKQMDVSNPYLLVNLSAILINPFIQGDDFLKIVSHFNTLNKDFCTIKPKKCAKIIFLHSFVGVYKEFSVTGDYFSYLKSLIYDVLKSTSLLKKLVLYLLTSTEMISCAIIDFRQKEKPYNNRAFDATCIRIFLYGRGDRNRTRADGVGDRCSTVKLHPCVSTT